MSNLPLRTELSHTQHLPPAEAWNNPKKWLRFENGIAVGINPDAEKLVLDCDDRGFVLGGEAVRLVRGLFKPGYVWRYDRSDPLTRPDIHHWYNPASAYAPEANGDNHSPWRFRNLPPNLAYMQRRFHNTIHAVTLPPAMPETEDMEHQIMAYEQAHRLFSELMQSARRTVDARRLFSMRKSTLEQHPEMLGDQDFDEIGEQILQTIFDRNFRGYRQALKRVQEARDQDQAAIEFGVVPSKANPSPDHVIRLLAKGAAALGTHESYVRELVS